MKRKLGIPHPVDALVENESENQAIRVLKEIRIEIITDLEQLFKSVNDIEVELDELQESLTKLSKFSSHQTCSVIKAKAEEARYIKADLSAHLESLKIYYGTTHQRSSIPTAFRSAAQKNIAICISEDLIDFFGHLKDSMDAIYKIETQAKILSEQSQYSTQYENNIFDSMMPNINLVSELVASRIGNALMNQGLDSVAIAKITREQAQIFADELYSAEKESLLVKQYNGLAGHAVSLMDQMQSGHTVIEDAVTRSDVVQQLTEENKALRTEVSALTQGVEEIKRLLRQDRQATVEIQPTHSPKMFG